MHYSHSLWSRLEPQISHCYAVWWLLTKYESSLNNSFGHIRLTARIWGQRIVHRHWRKCYSTKCYSGIWLRNIWGKFLYNSCISVKKNHVFFLYFFWPFMVKPFQVWKYGSLNNDEEYSATKIKQREFKIAHLQKYSLSLRWALWR